MKFAAAGDAIIIKRLPDKYDGFNEIVDWFSQADARYFNLETTLHREGECFAFPFNGGSYLRSEPEVLEDCKRFGLNMTSFCNNHTMDFAYDGVLKTLEHVNRSGIVNAGVGKNLDSASAPAYLDTPSGRVALIAITASGNSTYDDAVIAGRQSPRFPGRPGPNLLRYKDTLVVTKEQMEQIQAVADQTQVNAATNISKSEGYREAEAEGEFDFGKYVHFRVGDKSHKESHCNPKDLKRIDNAIYEAKLQADYIFVAVHCHELGGTSKEQPPQFLEEFAHHCIDSGADAIIGHGPHLLRPIEIYNGKPVFYSLGDFILHNENIPSSPEDYYEKYGLSSDETMHELIRVRSKDFTRGLQTKKVMFESVIPRWEMQDGRLIKLELLPVELGFGKPRSVNGNPSPAKDDSILLRLEKMSRKYGTQMKIHDGIAEIVI